MSIDVNDTNGKAAPNAPLIREPFSIADWHVEPATLRISRGDQARKLEPRVMQVLVFLAARPGVVVSREELEANVWQGRVVGYDAVANTIIKLRKAFGDDSRKPHVIETIPKTGYRLVADVRGTPVQGGGSAPGSFKGAAAAFSSINRRLWLPLALLVLLALVVATWLGSGSKVPATMGDRDVTELSRRPAIAVMPFGNPDGDDRQQYFSDGITEDLITDLSNIPGLLVVARNSVFAYRESVQPERVIGRELGVRYLLKGNLRRQRGRVRINVRLVDAEQGRILWAERYDRELEGLFEIQERIASRVAAALKIELEPPVRERLDRSYVTSIEAYDEFLRGIDFYGRRSATDMDTAISHFRRAIELDPGYARAYSSLALAYTRQVSDGLNSGDRWVLDQAERLVQQALEIDQTVPQIYFVKSQVQMYRGDLKGALRTMERAVELRPSYADGYGMMAWILHFAGRPKEGLKALAVAERLNPQMPSVYRLVKGASLYAIGAYEPAVETLSTASRISPHHPLIRLWLAAAYAASERIEDAEWEIEELLALNPEFQLEDVRSIYPFRDPQYLARFIGHLEQAGLGRSEGT